MYDDDRFVQVVESQILSGWEMNLARCFGARHATLWSGRASIKRSLH